VNTAQPSSPVTRVAFPGVSVTVTPSTALFVAPLTRTASVPLVASGPSVPMPTALSVSARTGLIGPMFGHVTVTVTSL
jgi:hypothetical protein